MSDAALSGEARRLLLVDDDQTVCETMARMLSLDGHTAELAAGGEEALDKFAPGKFDLVILDLEMPGMQGDELAAEIRKRAPSQPIVLVTAYGEMLNAMKECPPCVDLVLGKPFGFETLRVALEKVPKRS